MEQQPKKPTPKELADIAIAQALREGQAQLGDLMIEIEEKPE